MLLRGSARGYVIIDYQHTHTHARALGKCCTRYFPLNRTFPDADWRQRWRWWRFERLNKLTEKAAVAAAVVAAAVAALAAVVAVVAADVVCCLLLTLSSFFSFCC